MGKLSVKARAYIIGSILVSLGLFALNLGNFMSHKILPTLALAVVASATLVLKVEGATIRSHYNISFLVYAFTLVVLGPEACMIVILISNFVEWTWHKYPWYIQSFNIASYLVAVQAAVLISAGINPAGEFVSFIGVMSVLAAMGIFTLVNHLMVGIVIWLARGENFKHSGVFDLFPLMLDFTLLCMGGGLAYIWIFAPFGVVLGLLPLYLIYSTLKVPALERKTETDPKTGLFNAEFFQKNLKEEIERANSFNRPLTVVMADLDLLRNINNTYGHLAGDVVLIGVANILKESAREYDLVARFGGEEYAILMPETTPEQAYPLIEAIRAKVESTHFEVETSVTPIRATMSFGISGRSEEHVTDKELIHNADSALYHAKLKGRNGTFIYSEEGFICLFDQEVQIETLSTETLYQTGEYESRAQKAVPDRNKKAADYEIPAKRSISMESHSTAAKARQVSEAKNQVEIHRKYPFWLSNAFIGGMVVVALTLFYLGYDPGSVGARDWFGLSVFAALVILTEWYSIDIYVRNTSVSTSAVPVLAGVLLFGPLGALVLSVVFATVAMIKHRSPLNRYVFNLSNQLIAGMLVLHALSLSSVSYTQLPIWLELLISIAAVGAVYLITTVLISIGMGIERNHDIKQIWLHNFSWLAPFYLIMGLVIYALVLSYHTQGFIGMLVVIAPLLVLRLSQKQYLERTKEYVNELKAKNLELKESSEEIHLLNKGLLNTLAEVVDLRDPYVLGHSKQVARYALMIAENIGLPQRRLEMINKAALLHDIGKLGISEAILLKPDRLTPEEYRIVKHHVTLGAEILGASHVLQDLIPIVRYHHERYDGSGYPDGLAGEEIPVEARILCLADAVEAMASDRPYRRGLSKQEIVAELKKCAGSQFDPRLVDVFVAILEAEMQPVVINSARRMVLAEDQPAHVLLKTSGIAD